MKTLTTIILILISLNIFSQDATIFINKYGDTCTNISYGASLIFKNTTGTSSLAIGQTSVGGFYSGTESVKQYTVITDQLLFEYETDCYNDSIYIQVDEWVKEEHGGKGGMPKFTTGYQVTKWIWWHEEPTFKGFIKWLKEQK